MQILYIDTLLISNLAMNYLSLSLTARILHRSASVGRKLLASFLGGLYAVLAVVFSFSLLLHIPVLLLLSAFILFITFGNMGSGRLFLGGFLAFYIANFLLGGAAEALFGYLEDVFGTRTFFRLRAADIALIVGFTSYFLLKLAFRYFTGTPIAKQVSVRFSLGNRNLTLPLLVDSGCLLADPISGKAAVLVSVDAMEGFLPKEMFLYLKKRTDTLPSRSFLERRIRLLPAESVGGRKLLTALRLDGVFLVSEHGKDIPLDVLVAFSDEGCDFGGCKGILPARVYASKNDKRKRRTVS